MTWPQRAGSLIGSPLSSYLADTHAHRHGRGFIERETKVGTLGTIVDPWPFSTDDAGQSFPGGMVGVSFQDPLSFVDEAAFNASLIGVPGAVPGGYTARIVRDHNRRPLSLAAPTLGQYAPFALGGAGGWNGMGWLNDGVSNTSPRLRTATTLTNYSWFPECLGTSCLVNANSASSLGTGIPSTGLRYLRVSVPTYAFSAIPGATVNVSLSVFRVPYTYSGPSFYDLIDVATGTWMSPAVEIFRSPPFTAAYDSGFKVHGVDGNFYSDDNLRCWFASVVLILKADGTYRVNFASEADKWRTWMGPRCDVPLPFAVLGAGNAVVPGGVL